MPRNRESFILTFFFLFAEVLFSQCPNCEVISLPSKEHHLALVSILILLIIIDPLSLQNQMIDDVGSLAIEPLPLLTGSKAKRIVKAKQRIVKAKNDAVRMNFVFSSVV